MQEYTLTAIGRVEARGAAEAPTAYVRVHPEFRPGLAGLEDYSHVMVVYVLSEAEFQLREDLVKHPFGRQELPWVGVFGRRGKERPNRLGVSTVRVVRVEGEGVRVAGLDATDGTPVLDLKAFDPVYDQVENPTVPGWLEDNLDRYPGEGSAGG